MAAGACCEPAGGGRWTPRPGSIGSTDINAFAVGHFANDEAVTVEADGV
jgi:hypothetical protein